MPKSPCEALSHDKPLAVTQTNTLARTEVEAEAHKVGVGPDWAAEMEVTFKTWQRCEKGFSWKATGQRNQTSNWETARWGGGGKHLV